MEGWLSGLKRTLGKRAIGSPDPRVRISSLPPLKIKIIMKKRNMLTFIIVAAVIIITFFVLRHSADAPTKVTVDDTNISENSDYVGLSAQDARDLAEQREESFRVVEVDGEPQPATMDYRPGRINASVQD